MPSGSEEEPLLKRGTDTFETACNMINCFIGAGILTVPFAFRLAGYGAILALAVIAGLNWFTSLLLGQALDKAEKLHPDGPDVRLDFGQLALLAFGPVGQWLVSAVFALELWFALETFLVLTGINASIVTGLQRTTLIIAAGLLGMLSLSLPMRVIARFSFLGVCCMAVGLGALVVCGTYNEEKVRHTLVEPGNLVSAAGIFLYCFSGLPCLPNIRAAMQRPHEDYRNAVHIAFAFSTTYYLSIGMLGYYFYGDTLRQSFTENLVPRGFGPGAICVDCHGNCALLSALLFAFKLQVGFPLYATPVLTALGVGTAEDYTCAAGLWLWRFAFVCVSVAFAVLAQGALDAVAELMGAFLTNCTSVIFPCAVFIAVSRAKGDEISAAWMAVLGTIIALGVIFAAVGSYWACARFVAEQESAHLF